MKLYISFLIVLIAFCENSFSQISFNQSNDSLFKRAIKYGDVFTTIHFKCKENMDLDSISIPVTYEIRVSNNKKFVVVKLDDTLHFDGLAIFEIYNCKGKKISRYEGYDLNILDFNDQCDLILGGAFPSTNVNISSFLVMYNKNGTVVEKFPKGYYEGMEYKKIDSGNLFIVVGKVRGVNNLPDTVLVHIFNYKYKLISTTHVECITGNYHIIKIDENENEIILGNWQHLSKKPKEIRIGFNGIIKKDN